MSEYRKALVAAFVAFLGPIAAYLAVTGEWSWRALAAAVVTGLIAGGGTYAVPNAPSAYQRALERGRHEAGLRAGPD